MNGGWLLVAGTTIAAFGSMFAAGAASVSRLELSRWVAERHRAASLATSLLSAPGRVLGTAAFLSFAGTILAAIGSAALLDAVPATATSGFIVGGIPVFLGLAYALPRALGRRWAEPLMHTAGPWLARAAALWSAFAPGAGTPRAAGTVVSGGDLAPSSGTAGFVAGVIAFTERPVREIMTPRTEIVAAAEGAPLREVAALVEESGYTRLPVYRDSLDNIIGMVHAFDLLRAQENESLPLRPVAVTPSTRRCADLLVDLQRERHQFGVVLDEFGGTAGVVTLEDLLEELVGEIFDEYDRPPVIVEAGAELLDVEGTVACEELAAQFGVEFPVRTETVGGLLTNVLGRIPRLGERLVIGDLEFDVLGATETRVERVVIRRTGQHP